MLVSCVCIGEWHLVMRQSISGMEPDDAVGRGGWGEDEKTRRREEKKNVKLWCFPIAVSFWW